MISDKHISSDSIRKNCRLDACRWQLCNREKGLDIVPSRRVIQIHTPRCIRELGAVKRVVTRNQGRHGHSFNFLVQLIDS